MYRYLRGAIELGGYAIGHELPATEEVAFVSNPQRLPPTALVICNGNRGV